MPRSSGSHGRPARRPPLQGCGALDRPHGFAHACPPALGIGQHDVAADSPQGSTTGASAAGPAEGVGLRPQRLQRCQARGALDLRGEHLNSGGRRSNGSRAG
jgi:hypothetical protein